MKKTINYLFVGVGVVATLIFGGCSKSDSLPTIDGYSSSEDVSKANLVAHWSFDDNNKELISGTAPANSYGTVATVNGPLGKALDLTEGALVYPSITAIGGANSLSDFTVTLWVKVLNNGTDFTTFFGIFPTAATGAWGNLSASAETGWFPNRGAGDTLVLKANYLSQDPGGANGQDNRPDPRNKTAPVGVIKYTGQWTHFAVRWNSTTHKLQVFANGVSIGAYDDRGTTGPLIQGIPCQAVIGSLATPSIGFSSSADTWPKKATASIDDIRVFKSSIPDKDILALYDLGIAGK